MLFMFGLCAVFATAAVSCTPVTGGGGDYPGGVRITKFVIDGIEGVINQDEKTIEVVLPLKTDLTALTPEVEFAGASITPAQEQAVDFTGEVEYILLSKDGSATYYKVNVFAGNPHDYRIIAFDLEGVDEVSVSITEEDEAGGDVYVLVPFATDLSALKANVEHNGVSISPDDNTVRDFNETVQYTVTSALGSQRVYTVTVTDTPNTENDITRFAIGSIEGVITGTNITVTVPSSVSLTALRPVINVSLGATVSPGSNEAVTFTSGVAYQYVVTASSLDTKIYHVTVNQMLSADAALQNIIVNGYSLSPAFTSGNTEYLLTVYTDTITVTATANDTSARLMYVENNNTLLTSGTPFTSKALSVGANSTVTVKVTAENGTTTKSYVLRVTHSDFPAGTVIDNTLTVSNITEWNNAISTIKSRGNNKSHIINITGDFNVSATTATFGTITGLTVVIQGSKQLGLSSNGKLLDVGTNQNIILRDITLKGRNNTKALVYVNSGAKFEMRGRAKITGNAIESYDWIYGGGVNVSGGGSFTMRDNASVSGNAISGIYITSFGAGVYVDGTFTMWDKASVSGNIGIKDTGTCYGGGVYLAGNGSFTMRDNAVVSGNNTSGGGHGGGVFLKSGAFTMLDNSSVCDNIGEGVYSEGGTFIMQNNASLSRNSSGGVRLGSSTLIMRDNASVSGNAGSPGGGVWVSSNAVFIMRENSSVSGNTNGLAGVFITDTGAFRIEGGTLQSLYNYDYSSGSTAEYGVFNPDGTWQKIGIFNGSYGAIKVVNGMKQ